MAAKEFDARVKFKRDTSANWTANNPVLLNGEMIIVDTASGEKEQRQEMEQKLILNCLLMMKRFITL